MKKQGPLLTYVLILITAGFYMFYWQYITMNYLNEHLDDKRFNSSGRIAHIIGVLGVVFLYNEFILNRFAMTADKPLALIIILGGLFITLGWFFMIIDNIRDIAKSIYMIEEKMNFDSKISVNKATILFFLYYSTVYYIQKHIIYIHMDRVLVND